MVFSQDERKAWWDQHAALLPLEMSEQERLRLEDVTGNIPLLLNCFLVAEGDKRTFEEVWSEQFATSKHAKDIADQIEAFARKQRREGEVACAEHIDHLKSFLFEQTRSSYDPLYYDHRYMFVDNNRMGHCAGGLARDCVAMVLRSLGHGSVFLEGSCLSMIRNSTNPSVRGFLVEQVAISTIERNGLDIFGTVRVPTKVIYFDKGDESILATEPGTVLCLPRPFNYPNIDGAVRHAEEEMKSDKVEVGPFQVTIADLAKHANSMDKFFAPGVASKWAGGKVAEFQFTWISRHPPKADTAHEQLEKQLRGVLKVVRLAFVERFQQLDQKIMEALGSSD